MYKITIRELLEGIRTRHIYKSGQDTEDVTEPMLKSKVIYVQEFENLDMQKLVAFLNTESS